MKKLFTFFVLFSALALVIGCHSGSGSGSESESKPVEDNMNEKIQNVFFDTPFGASREEVIQNFAKHGFSVDGYYSTDALLHFQPIKGNRYSFGNMTWENLRVAFKNDKFYGIDFYNAFKDKVEAMGDYDNILSTVSKKYKMNTVEPKDTTIYKKSVGYCVQNLGIGVDVYRYESFGKSIFFGVELWYRDFNIQSEVSDEL